jgi:enamine deaminase RidA (YjgF/YER057c/UK114 family)
MADKKISALTAASTPLAGTEVFPIVQSSTTVKATIANVQAAPVAAGTGAGIQFLNTSKVPSTSTALQFDGQNLGVGQYPSNAANITTNIELPYGATIASRSNTTAPQLYIMSNALGTGYAPTYAINGYATQYQMQGFDGNHYWSTASTGSAGAAINFVQRMQLSHSTGDLTVNTGNLVVSNGKGIDFSATPGTGTSELFNDYEEGVFTATLTCTTGTITLNSSQDQMQYTKIGRMVYISGQIGVSSVSSPTGSLKLAGLPFTTSNSLGELAGRGAGTVVADTVAITINNTVLTFLSNATVMTIEKYAAGVPANMAADVSASSSFWVNAWYVAA